MAVIVPGSLMPWTSHDAANKPAKATNAIARARGASDRKRS
jgi:hypothetical protein